MSWECRDALSLIQELQAGCETTVAEETIGRVKTLWQQGFDLKWPILNPRRRKEEAFNLDKAIRQLQQEWDQALLSKAKLQQKILLGQTAYTVSDILEDCIFGEAGSSSFLPLSVSDFANNTIDLSEEEQARWAAARAFLTSTMLLKEIIEADKYLRWRRNEPAHGKSQIKETTATDLHTWAGLHCKAKAVVPVQRYMPVLNKLSTKGRPLAPVTGSSCAAPVIIVSHT
ncbi:TPA: hypothetical protein ACH3X1_015939 [Trebouxia sp. C0004]